MPALSVAQHLDAAHVCGILHTAFHMNVVPTMAIGRNLVSYELAYAREALDQKSAVGCCDQRARRSHGRSVRKRVSALGTLPTILQAYRLFV
jgi:hypothetical protein